jgi:hypothetical protein
MGEISKASDVPEDEALFLLVGDKLVMKSTTVRLCSVSSIGLDEITDNGAAPGFKFKSLVNAYKKRELKFDSTNLYLRHTTTEQTSPTTAGT